MSEQRPNFLEKLPRSVKGLGALALMTAILTPAFLSERVTSHRVNGQRQELIKDVQDLQRRGEIIKATGEDPDPKSHELAEALGLEQSPEQKQP